MNGCDSVFACGRSTLLLLTCLALAPVTISQVSIGPKAAPTEAPAPSAYAGDSACAQCHRKESEFYGLTPHARDSAPGTAEAHYG